jgi:AcrR family transcriptional regulator
VSEPGRPTKAERTRERVLHAASTVISQSGYAVTTLADVARLADIKVGSLYYHFASKDELMDEMISRGTAFVLSEMERAVKDLGPGSTAPSRLRAALATYLTAIHHEEEAYARATLRLLEEAPQTLLVRHDAEFRRNRQYVQTLMGEAKDEGALAAVRDVRTGRLAIFAVMNESIHWPARNQETATAVMLLLADLLGL